MKWVDRVMWVFDEACRKGKVCKFMQRAWEKRVDQLLLKTIAMSQF